jgi:hypothetical protein
MEETHLLLSLLWKARYKFSKRKPRFARILSITLGFTCHKDNADWALRGNRPSAPFQPALGLLDMMMSFFLYVHERLGTAVGVLTQLLGSQHHPVAYLSKQLDAVSRGWPPCLCTLAAPAILVAETDKLTLG